MIPTQGQAPAEIVSFWRDAGRDRWYAKDDAFDALLRERFEAGHFAAARRECDGWADDAEGSLALMILLDQFPRNCFRNSAHMFATDGLARYFARRAIASGHDQQVETPLRVFLYLPFMHSEDPAEQEESVRFCSALDADTQKYAEIHRDIIVRFGRFPHRNGMLGRDTTDVERAFLVGGGFAG